MLYRVPYRSQDLEAYAPNLLIVIGEASLFNVPRGLAAQGRTSVLVYYVLATLFASSTFFSIFITPLIYSKKSPDLKIRQIIFFIFFDEVPKILFSYFYALSLLPKYYKFLKPLTEFIFLLFSFFCQSCEASLS